MQNLDLLVIPGITDPAVKACLARTRKCSQYIKSVADVLAGICPFCQLDPNHNKEVEGIHGRHWKVIYSSSPEKFTRLHLLMIPTDRVGGKHITDLLQLCGDAQMEFWAIYAIICQKFDLPHRGIQCRDGDATQLAGTISHAHVHIMIPDGRGRVESPMSKTEEDEQMSLRRAIVFEKIRTGTKLSELNPAECELVNGRL